MHGGRYHVISVVDTDDIGVGEVGKDYRILVLAVTLVANVEVLEVGMWPVLRIVVGIPVHASFAASLWIAAKCGFDSALQHFVKVDVLMRVGQRHGDVAELVEYRFESFTPL